MPYQAPRGTTDILPEEQPYWDYVQRKAAEICRLYGYERIDTPIFEDTALFIRSAGEYTDVAQKEVYTFDDRGGNSLSLKPEGTPAVCRAYIQHGMQNLPQPVKLYYISPIFRYDRPQAGRYRQHYQFGCEAIGSDDPVMDSEIISIIWELCRSLGLEKLSLGLNSIGCKECRPAYLEELKKHYHGHTTGLCSDCKTRLEKNPMRLLDCKQASCQPVADSAPKSADYLCDDCREHFSSLKRYLEILGIPYTVNERLVRGLDYYTRTVFEIEPEDQKGQSSIGGGGRYDGLIEELGGKPTPGVGFGSGIERMILNVKQQSIDIPGQEKPEVFISCMGEKAREQALKLASELRQDNAGVILAVGNRSLKAQLRQANTLGVSYTIILGEDEVKSGTAVLRYMADARQETVPINKIQKLLK